MPYKKLIPVVFGSTKTGLTTVGYQLKNADATNNGSRITTGIVEIGFGIYQADITIPDGHKGGVLWDTGEATPKHVYEGINPGNDENTDVKISSINAGSGANTVTITLTESGGTPVIPGALVAVKTVGGATLLATGTTDANGKVIFNLDNGTYDVHSSKLGSYSFILPETLTVSGVTTDSYIGTPLSVSAPVEANTSRLFIWAKNPDSTLITTGLTGTVRIDILPFEASSASFAGQEIAFVKDASDFWYVDVVYGATVDIKIPALGVDLNNVVVPSQTTTDITIL